MEGHGSTCYRQDSVMGKEEELKKEIRALEEKLIDREKALPAHSVRSHQIMLIEDLELRIEQKK